MFRHPRSFIKQDFIFVVFFFWRSILVMEIACRDNRIMKLRAELLIRQAALKERYSQLRGVRAENQYLDGVIADYEKYYAYIRKLKEDQLLAVETISDYIGNIAMTTELTQEALEASKMQQDELLRKAADIKQELADMVDGE